MASSPLVRRRLAGARPVVGVLGLRLATIGLLMLAWELVAASGFLPKEIFPSVPAIGGSLVRFLTQASFYQNLAVTGIEVSAAFLVGSGLGLAVGAVGGISNYVGKVIDPYLHYLAPTPKIIFLPLMLLMFGVDMGSKIALGVVSAFFPVAVATLAGMRQIAPVLVRVGHSFRLSTTQMLAKVYFPALVIPITGGLGLGLGSAITGVLLGECKMASRGLGFLIIESYRNLRIADMYSLLLVSFFLAVLATVGIETAGRRISRNDVRSR